MARLFVALDLPDAVVAALVAWRRPVLRERRSPLVLRAVAPESLHVTLCFLGERPDTAIAPLATIVEACARPLAGLELGEPLWLPRRRPRVLAVALEDHHGGLGALQETLLERLVADGWHQRESRPYLPHVTVARVRGGDASGRLDAGAVDAHRASLPPLPALAFDGAAVTLYRSRLEPSGARYEALVRAPLA